ncbi:MAG: hypothetical protein ACI9P5_003019 [Saprospiraceae bacterium]|jgi:hypothetical protein
MFIKKAAAIPAGAKCIVIWNIKDFPQNILQQYTIEAIKPDRFIDQLFLIDKEKVKEAFTNQLYSTKNPKLSEDQLIKILIKNRISNMIYDLNSDS